MSRFVDESDTVIGVEGNQIMVGVGFADQREAVIEEEDIEIMVGVVR